MGKTLRWFEPIFYNDEQVGFVMVGKYYSDIRSINSYDGNITISKYNDKKVFNITLFKGGEIK